MIGLCTYAILGDLYYKKWSISYRYNVIRNESEQLLIYK